MNHQTTPDFFEFYGLPLALQVDAAELRRIYLINSRKYHPDFHTLASGDEQTRALELSTLNNEAFKVLSDPDRLLQYVLTLKGLLAGEETENKIPQSFLLEMMEINEKIMELEFDPAPEAYHAALEAVHSLESALEQSIGTIRKEWSEASGKPDDLVTAKDYFLKKRYLLRVKENLSKFAPAFEKH